MLSREEEGKRVSATEFWCSGDENFTRGCSVVCVCVCVCEESDWEHYRPQSTNFYCSEIEIVRGRIYLWRRRRPSSPRGCMERTERQTPIQRDVCQWQRDAGRCLPKEEKLYAIYACCCGMCGVTRRGTPVPPSVYVWGDFTPWQEGRRLKQLPANMVQRHVVCRRSGNNSLRRDQHRGRPSSFEIPLEGVVAYRAIATTIPGEKEGIGIESARGGEKGLRSSPVRCKAGEREGVVRRAKSVWIHAEKGGGQDDAHTVRRYPRPARATSGP